MAYEELIERLKDYGLSEEESRTYLFLLMAGPSPARIVAHNLRTYRVKAYHILKALQDRSLVETTVERPVKFIAIPLKEALNNLISEVQSRVDEAIIKVSSLEARKKEIMDIWRKLYKVEASIKVEPHFHVLQGRKQIYTLLLRMFEKAEEEICLATTINDLYRLSFAGIDERMRDLVNDGIRIRLLTQVDQSGVEAVENYLGFAKIRHIDLPTKMRITVIDESEGLTTFTIDDSMSMTTKEDTALWTNASNYVEALKVFIEALWSGGVSARDILLKHEAQQALIENLKNVKKILEEADWIVEIPGELVGRSGIKHSFSLVAKHPSRLDKSIVMDLLMEDEALHKIASLNAKVIDVKPSIPLLAANKPFRNEEIKLANLFTIRLVYPIDAQQLSKIIIEETKTGFKR